jgi:hypothetical protein
MNTNHTTRTALRASVLTTVLAGLLLGAPAVAFADTPTPAPTPPRISTRNPVVQSQKPKPVDLVPGQLDSSNSGGPQQGVEPLVVYGHNWNAGDSIRIYVGSGPTGFNWWWGFATVAPGGHIAATINCDTVGAGALDAGSPHVSQESAFAVDQTTGAGPSNSISVSCVDQ